MALVFAERVFEKTTTSGTGTITRNGAVDGHQSFNVVGDGNTTPYVLVDGVDWETGTGTVTVGTNQLSRDTVHDSSNGGSKISLSGGEALVFSGITAQTITDILSSLASKLDSSSYTAADVLTKIKTVDGAGSGLDADLLDGAHLSALVQISGTQTITGSKKFRSVLTLEAANVASGNTNRNGMSIGYETANYTRHYWAPINDGSFDFTKEFGFDHDDQQWYFESKVGVSDVVTVNLGGTVPSLASYTPVVVVSNCGTASDDAEIHVIAGTSGDAGLMFGDSAAAAGGMIRYRNSSPQFRFDVEGSGGDFYVFPGYSQTKWMTLGISGDTPSSGGSGYGLTLDDNGGHPSTPPTGKLYVYNNGGTLYVKDDSGTETALN